LVVANLPSSVPQLACMAIGILTVFSPVTPAGNNLLTLANKKRNVVAMAVVSAAFRRRFRRGSLENESLVKFVVNSRPCNNIKLHCGVKFAVKFDETPAVPGAGNDGGSFWK
jgi:hypothetical protein